MPTGSGVRQGAESIEAVEAAILRAVEEAGPVSAGVLVERLEQQRGTGEAAVREAVWSLIDEKELCVTWDAKLSPLDH